jgi:phosphate starvation-inducible protein PhoH
VRHRLVKAIIKAYDREREQNEMKDNRFDKF